MSVVQFFKRFFEPAPPKKTFRQIVVDATKRELDRILPAMIEEQIFRLFEKEPDVNLTKVGFDWALVLYFEKSWPGISRHTALSFAKDCLEIPYGTSGYDWSASAAKELVLQYVSQHGEVA
ncbi:hypothetical protein MRBLRH13_000216 [Agrobacterium radiobacter]|uniref:hypothetical protein n=1 Tax=Agrobacterium radiobacter TaxID=362 RepID=UPI003424C76F